MKRKIFMMAIAGLMVISSCQKPLENNPFANDKLSNELGATNVTVTCPPTVLSGTITTNTTLTTGSSYLLSGNVVIDGATLTIQPGVVIMGEKSTNGALIIKPNAQISAVGTVTNPIVFTSDQAAGSRAAGDWFGVAILGNAPNNRSNSFNLTINGTSFSAGGSSIASSAGSFEYVQIHYAGAGGGTGSDVLTESALVLASIGNGMTVKNLQITNSLKDGLGIWGGEVGIKQLFTHRIQRSDYKASQGFRGNVQSILAFKDNITTPSSPIYPSLEISNQLIGTTSTRFTYPTISNATLLGGNFCESSDPDYKDAIMIKQDGNARIYNSVIEGFGQYALYLDGNNVVANTKATTDQLQFSYNSIVSSATTPYGRNITSSWASLGCFNLSTDDMQQWLTSGPLPSCRESGNQINGGIDIGYYNSSLCGNKCSTFPNLYVNTGTTDLDAPDYSMLSGFFDQPDYRGALQSSMDTWLVDTWIDFCQSTRNYCH
ncbi:hypothetical protein D3C86_948140 [compost metagenome]